MCVSCSGDAIAELERRPSPHFQNHHDLSASPRANDTKAIDVNDALERFTLWAGNTGALLSPTSRLSLDSRLAAAPETLDQVCEVLNDLADAIADSKHYNDDTIDPGTGMTNVWNTPTPKVLALGSVQDALEEAHSQMDIISEYLISLFRIAMIIRKSNKYPKLSEKLRKHLRGVNVKRRQVIKYCHDHKTRLSNEDGDKALPDLARTGVGSSKASTFAFGVASDLKFDAAEVTFDEDVVSQLSVSTASAANSTLALPRLSKLSPHGEPFECPICCTFQSFRLEGAWRKHAFHDLRAYACTADCGEIFGDRNAWFEHELRQHRSRYICSLCACPGLLTEVDYKEHIRSSHGSFDEEQSQRLLDSNRQINSVFRAQDCPFCDEWASILSAKRDPKGKGRQDDKCDPTVSASRFRRHVGTHQEQIAIFAGPREAEDEDEAATPTSATSGSGKEPHSPSLPDSDNGGELQPRAAEEPIQVSDVVSDRNTDSFASTPSHFDHRPGPRVGPKETGYTLNSTDARCSPYPDLEEDLVASLIDLGGHVSRQYEVDAGGRMVQGPPIKFTETKQTPQPLWEVEVPEKARAYQSLTDEIGETLSSQYHVDNVNDGPKSAHGNALDADVAAAGIGSNPMEELLMIQRRLETEIIPGCRTFISANSANRVRKDHLRLSEMLKVVLMNIDGVSRGGNELIHGLGRKLASTVESELAVLDKAFKSGGRRLWNCGSCGRQVVFCKGTKDGTYEVGSGEGTNMVIATDPLYFCKCGDDFICLKCVVVEAEICKCYTPGELRRRQAKGQV
uniref:C2H2-type domain-containing protein n=1 Tax=Pyricularia oryzae (strain P131) TaxID=1143193 RepID=L7IY26_PYRO1